MLKITSFFVGVDVSKNTLDVCIYPNNESFKFANSVMGINALLKKLSYYSVVEQIVCESSGGYENLLLNLCADANYKVWQVDPKRIKAFIASQGIKAKTDKIDAKMIARFASLHKAEYVKYKRSDNNDKISALVKRRANLTEMAAIEKRRAKGPVGYYCKNSIENILNFIDQEINTVTTEINDLISQDKEMLERKKILESIPGIGATTATALIADMPELGRIENKQAAALLGVVPYTRQSGTYQGIETINGGRSAPRKALYMAALTATRCNPVMKTFYNRLRSAGKKPKVAVVAVMNKLIVTSNAMLKNKTTWTLVASS
jgi:transposase